MLKKIRPTSGIKASIHIPGSKSITHRALLMAALAEGKSEIRNPLLSEDTLLTSQALGQLGVAITRKEGMVHVAPPEKRWASPDGPILLGNSGTSMRLLLAVAATGSGRFIFDGSPRLRERPIGPVLEALSSLGVEPRYLGAKGYPPVEILSQGLTGGEALVDARESSQFLSALLIASPCAKRETRVTWIEPVASYPYVTLTLAMMRQFGIGYQWLDSNLLVIPAPQSYPPLRYLVEGDCSSASYFWAAAALTSGEVFTSPITPESLQGDCRFLRVIEGMGCRVSWDAKGVWVKGPERLLPVDRDMNEMPDMVPTLAVLGAFAEGPTRIRNVSHLRVKESDRLKVVASELQKFGVPVEELEDGLVIHGGKVLSPQEEIESHDDHRIAMAFAVAGLRVEGVAIHGAEAVAKSFPLFWDTFEGLY